MFSDISAIIPKPEVVALLGASGQGKSTLLRILGRIDSFDEGMIYLNGHAMEQLKSIEWRKKVTYVAQQAVMLSGSIEDNLRLVSRIHNRPFEQELARKLMSEADLERLEWSKPVQGLSGGEKQRVALVRSLLLRPEIMLLDEVTASLDQHSRHAVEAMLLKWHQREGTSLIWVTHDLEQARLCTQRVWFLAEKTLLEDRDTYSFFHSPSSTAAQNFLNLPLSGEG
jgi:putative ABC transport system ATP-binding protein